ncbi:MULTISPECIES: hypothetical protein [Chryseobacterium]|uniref:Dolichyl-phosphate-mannose-protein mannosyltransferase n=1 Tax=Chryseobacterium geocarposphaerae TaxID=1416776 RepID=A0ABU1LF72_9FLAO|nr:MULTISPECIES: hypothetical protein [Chryseobacterium]MDR6405363.1 hypothetical protein [Chryseobacterium geocarposphaerae]MDR6697522.1 hypothetical protein [Chryseobacterium ginsenosidimutans]
MKILLDKKDTILNLTVFSGVILFFILRLFLSSGELRPDSIQYLLQAQNFWQCKVNFPLGYAFCIKILHLITGSYLAASKIINLLSYIGIIAFSYKKKFFFSQTLLVFSFYPFINLYTLSLSEPLYFLINYLIIYCIYRVIENGFHKKYIFSTGILFFLLVSVRFSGIFVFLTSIFFLGFLAYQKRYSLQAYFIFVLSSASGICSYLLINYFYCGNALGDRSHLQFHPSNILGFISELGTSILQDFSFFNIFIHKGILEKTSSINALLSICIFLLVIFILIKKNKKIGSFNCYLLLSFLGILVSIIYSHYTTKIDYNIRIKSTAYLYLLFFISLNITRKALNVLKLFVVFALTINCFTLIKYSEKITRQIKWNETLICTPNNKSVHIIYKDLKDNTVKSNAKILLFKALLIDKGYVFYESEIPDQRPSSCNIKASEIIR